MSIGLDHAPGQWKLCVVDQGSLTDAQTFAATSEMLAALRQVCALYPEPTMVVSLDMATPFRALQDLTSEQLEFLMRDSEAIPTSPGEIGAALIALRELSSRSYCAPSVAYLPTLPPYRRLLRSSLGSAREVCTAVALLHHMREQDATWQEMNFLLVSAGRHATSILVLKDGQIINGLGTLQGSSPAVAQAHLAALESCATEPDEAQQDARQHAFQEAFWEGLSQELAGLLAIHHIEDLVVLGQEGRRLIERLADLYPVYLFPHGDPDREGYETALGAALLAEGLDRPGKAAELVAYLQLRQAGPVKPLSVSSSLF